MGIKFRYLPIILATVIVSAVSFSASGQEGVPPTSEDATAEADHEALDPDPCTRISCSGHGSCVVKNGEPMCACEPEYMPDAVTGINCVPMNSPEHRQVQAMPVQIVQPAVPTADYADLVRMKVDMQRSRKAGGIAMLAVGIVFAVSAIPLYAVGIVEGNNTWCGDYYYEDDCNEFDGAWAMVFIGPGLASMFAVGTPLIVAGSIRMSRARKELARIQNAENRSAPIAFTVPGLTIFSQREHAPSGLGLSFGGTF